ncbi:GNAT family N-acetyltransferase [Aliiroseovarius crassostreae]|uniref:GNAT family N-acetyltransferase n=1 Tax=Aliiroseovarius crassostreae TaxID=154981 RepID=UPI0021FFA480|nr:GNAT family N-acetyltransferase [Aliiroseovarius crassostreae]UWQ09138.1 GNAT family N-acetyltransferase [Aliiroseovarius crassostreae]UWQ12215.1 GNAT family N-acetyltransferase [Aliiroseovarius crassostreae]
MLIETERFTLRPLSVQDRDQVVKGLNDYEVTKWLTVVPFPYGPADFDGFLAFLEGKPAHEALAICKGEGVLGVIGIGDSLGYWLARSHQGQGVMTEAARALVAWYFCNTPADTLLSGHFHGNQSSRNVLTKLGFMSTGQVERAFCVSQNKTQDLVKLCLTRADWEGRQ